MAHRAKRICSGLGFSQDALPEKKFQLEWRLVNCRAHVHRVVNSQGAAVDRE
jgi:hypothetical protein